ncbi:MAG: acetyl-CoA carboxylase biotin carboxylase subunit [Thermoleophilia bacterium]|nr:acetyl-CoA carboxylase biotin carboxylase subunit [Thermoleophilia bacterium]
MKGEDRSVRKVLVANRGEIALRVIRACRELGLGSVAVYSTADEQALHVRVADEAVCIGPPHARESYLDGGAVLRAAREAGADAVHPGYGFLAENARFAAACRAAGLVFVGPAPELIEEMGDKAKARRRARDAGVPTVPGTDELASVDEALESAAAIGYPVMVKAVAGGGGRGIRTASEPDELRSVVVDAAREAEAAFGDGSFYLERLLPDARHVEVQVLGDEHGNMIHLYERECSLQRRRQKVLEEAPSPVLDSAAREAIAADALRLARAVGYTGAGTLEFLLDRAGSFHFIEMNTRIQVEHPVTEMVVGVDIVKEQLRVAAGERLGVVQDEVAVRGAAIEFRINAEDPERRFLPSPGEITALELPGGPGVRVDTAVFAGYRIPPFYDSLIAKLIVWDRTREEAMARGERALSELRIEGVKTTVPLHLGLLSDGLFRAGDYHVDFLESKLGH